MRTRLVVLILLLHAVVLPAAEKKTITIKGSDTMVILVQQWTETYPGKQIVQFQVTGGGSGTGISALINGTTDICSSSRSIKPAEVRQILEKYHSKGVEVPVARDGITLYVHAKNPVARLTMEEIRKIYTGEITNWKQVGGKDAKIILYSRENNSGTYQYFKEHVLENKDFAANAQNMVGTGALVNAVRKDPNGIGFGGVAYATGIRQLAVAKDKQSEYITPTEENILRETYPLSRYLFFYLRERPSGDIKKFIDWVLGKDGQKVVRDIGYISIKK